MPTFLGPVAAPLESLTLIQIVGRGNLCLLVSIANSLKLVDEKRTAAV
jgi:hypothetical protein